MRKIMSVMLVGVIMLSAFIGILGGGYTNGINYTSENSNQQKNDTISQAMKLMGGVFTKNLGQLNNSDVKYYLSSGSGGIAFCKGYVMLTILEKPKNNDLKSLHKKPWKVPKNSVRKGWAIKLIFVGSNNVQPIGIEPVKWHNNYFIGNNPAKWITNVPNYRKVVYKNLWDGIDLVYYTTEEGVVR